MYKAIIRRTDDFAGNHLSDLPKSSEVEGSFEAEDKQQLIKKIASFIKVTEKDLQDNFKDGTFVVGNDKAPFTNYLKYEIVVTDQQGKTIPLFD